MPALNVIPALEALTQDKSCNRSNWLAWVHKSFLAVMDEMGELGGSPWCFPAVEATEERLRAAGFTDLQVWMNTEPTPFDSLEEMAAFIRTSCLGPWLERMPAEQQNGFVHEVASRLPTLELDYVRLNVIARKA